MYIFISVSVSLFAAEANDEIVKVTFGELRRDVSLFAAAMRKMGIQTGDRVVGESQMYCSLSHWGKTREYGKNGISIL